MNRKDEHNEYNLVRLDENKLKDLETLYKAVYGHKPAKNYLLKKYNTAYTGAQYIGHIAVDSKNIPVAYFGVIPCFIQYNDKIILAAQAADAMTFSQYRYKGFFVELARKTFDLGKEAGIQLVFGFPNQNSYHGLVHKLGWKMTEYMERFSIPVNSGFGGVYRDDRYLKYKTYSETKVIKIGNAKVWIKIQNGFVIGDIEMTGNDFEALINGIKKIAKRVGTANIFFQVSPGTRLHTLFTEKYKPAPSFPIIFLDLGADIPLNKLKFSFADIDIF